MEKKLKKVQRGAAVGFVLLKIIRILFIIMGVALIAGLVILAVVNENNLPLDAVKDGKLVLDLRELSQANLDNLPNIGTLIQDGVLTLDLRDAKLAVLMLMGAGVLALAAAYAVMAVVGKLFKHMKKEDTPFTAGNIRRLRIVGTLHLVFWVCGIALSYFISVEFARRLGLPAERVNLSLNLSAVFAALIYFFLARVFSFGKAQGEAIQIVQPAPEPEPVPASIPAPAPEPAPVAIPEPVYEAVPEAEYQPPTAPEGEPEVVYATEPVEAAVEAVAEPVEAAAEAVAEAVDHEV